MSWNVYLIAKPEVLARALEKHSTTLSGESKEEFDLALPYLKGLLALNFGSNQVFVSLTASGHGIHQTPILGQEKKMLSSTCCVEIKPIYGIVLD